MPNLMRRRIVKPGYIPLKNIFESMGTNYSPLNYTDIQHLYYMTDEEMSKYEKSCTIYRNIDEYINNVSVTTDKLENLKISRISHSILNNIPSHIKDNTSDRELYNILCHKDIEDDWDWFSEECISLINY